MQSIEKAANRIKELVPEARVATAHGQMGEHRLEQVMLDFWEKRFDVLVCTTIVESGLDVSNANTMIIERSDTLGPVPAAPAARTGRAGRRERAYAYFLYPQDKPLTETAHERLATLAQHSDLGGGMAIAMKDLEIRGAGNLLGGEQSGHIADVGLRPLRAARRRGRLRVPPGRLRRSSSRSRSRSSCRSTRTCRTTTSRSERLRLEMYKRLAEVRTDEDVRLLHEELLDRYGTPPEPVTRLLAVASFRARARQAGVSEVTVQGKYVRFHPVDLPDSRVVRLNRLSPEEPLQGPRAYHAGAAATAVRLRCAAASRRGAARLGADR